MARGEAHPPLVGREEELVRLDAALAGRAERPGLFLGGEAGIGKTRLVTEFAQRARAAGATVVTGGCLELGADVLPLAPFVEALGRLYETLGGAADEAVGAGRPDMAAILPELGPSPAAEPDRVRLFEAVRGMLERSPDPLLFVLEDVHWADRSSLALLAYLVRRLRHGRTFVLATFRSDEVTTEHPLAPVVAELTHSGKAARLELRRLLSAEVEELIHGLRADVAPAEVASVVAQAEGNPLYAEELVAHGPMSAGRMPSTLRELLLVRIRGLREDARRVLALAATAGRPVPYAFLAAAWVGPGADLDRGLREALGRGVLVQGLEPSRLAFRHALFGAAVEEDLLPGERLELHTRFASLLLERPDLAASTEAGAAAEIAGHWYAAERYPEALETSVRAAEAAERVPAFAEAHTFYGRALELWPLVEAAGASLPLDRVTLLERAAESAMVEGARTRGVALLREAIEEVDPATNPWRAGALHRRLGQSLYESGATSAAVAAFEAALRLVPADPPSIERAEVVAIHGRLLAFDGRYEQGEPVLEEALTQVHALRPVGADVRAIEALVFDGLGWCRYWRSDLPGALELFRPARLAALEDGLPAAIGALTMHEGCVLFYLDRFDEAIDIARTARERLRAVGLEVRHGLSAMYWAALSELYSGRWATLERTIAEALALDPPPHVQGNLLEVRTILRARQGRADEAQLDLTECMTLAATGVTDLTAVQHEEAEIAVALLERRWTEVRAIVARLVTLHPASAANLREDYRSGLLAEMEEAAEARRQHAAERVARAVEVAQGYAVGMQAVYAAAAEGFPGGAPATFEADAAIAEALLARVEGRSAPDLWARAAELREPVGMPYELAYSRLRQAEAMLKSGGARPEAARHLRQAHGIACELGAEPLRQEVAALAQRARIDLAKASTPPPTRPSDSSGLSAREREVLAMLVDGRSNREIGETLFISEKTASVHVTHILDKLGVTSRGAAAATAVRDGLLPGSERR
jgi:DNA-binding CsgD family transcriptional regulator